MNIGKQGADLCSSSMSQMVVEACLADVDLWRRYLDDIRGRYERRRDVMLAALESAMPEGATWTRPAGGLFLWATLPEVLDTTNLLARALRSNVAFVPGRAAYTDGRGGDSMRLNFSGVDEQEIQEGVRRIGAVVTEQLELYGDMVGEPLPRRRAVDRGEPVGETAPEGALVQFPRRPRGRAPVRVAVPLRGPSFERQISIAGAQRVVHALGELGHKAILIDVGRDLVEQLTDARPDAAIIVMHGAVGEDGSVQAVLEGLGIPHQAPSAAACRRVWDKAITKVCSMRQGSPCRRAWCSTVSRSRRSAPPARSRPSPSGSATRSSSSRPARAPRSA